MSYVLLKLADELEWTQKKIQETGGKISTYPRGTLDIIKNGDKKYFKKLEYFVQENDGQVKRRRKATYIGSAENPTVVQLAERAYCDKLNRMLKSNESAIRHFLKNYTPFPEQSAFDSMPEWKRAIARDAYRPNAGFIDGWLAEPYEKNPFHADKYSIDTLRGDKVRSKDEREIANELYRAGIPYRNDCAVDLAGVKKYCDFVILHPLTLELYYWEHSGMLDSEKYNKNNYGRISLYAQAGILLGERLIMTGGTHDDVIPTNTIQRIIAVYFT